MKRLIQLEFLKLKSNKAMWWLLGLYLVSLVFISFSGGLILSYLSDNGLQYNGIDPTILPIYDFDDIWQNLAYLGYFFKMFPAFLIIISVSNEFSFKTHRQNIIDGLSRFEFFLSKTVFAGFLAVISGVLILSLGLVLGFTHSSVIDFSSIVDGIIFVPAHIFQLFVYFLMAIFLTLLIRKTGITIVLFLMYTVILEPIVTSIIGIWYPTFASFFPLESISSIVHFPFSRYILLETQNFISGPDILKALFWCSILGYGIYYQLVKRDF